MTAASVNLKDVGASVAECERKAGREGVATIVGYWMFTQAPVRPGGVFFGSVRTAIKQVWSDEDANTVSEGLVRGVAHRLNANGFRATKNDRGWRWAVPASWSWTHPEERPEPEPIEVPEPGPVRRSFRCTDCGETFEDQLTYARHRQAAHLHRLPNESRRALLREVRADPGHSVSVYAERAGIGESAAGKAMGGLRREGKVRLDEGIGWFPTRGGKCRTPIPEKVVVVNPAPEPERSNGRVIMRPDGSMWRVVRELPDGSVELEPVTS